MRGLEFKKFAVHSKFAGGHGSDLRQNSQVSIHQFTPRRNRRRGIPRRAQKLLQGVLAIAILFQICYPLVSGQALLFVTFGTVYAGALAMLVHAYYSYGFRYFASYFGITFIFAFAVEEVGARTGWPFGNYSYDSSLGVFISSVPLIVPFAWIMMAHPVLVAARRVTSNWIFLYGGALLMAWDLFLEPQMVSAGRWKWDFEGAHVPFQSEIPISNTAGWLFAGMGLMALLNALLPKERRKESAGIGAVDVFLGWTLFAGIVGNLFFFSRPGVAGFAGAVFLTLLSPYIYSRWFGQP